MRSQGLQWSVGYVEKSQDHSGCPIAEDFTAGNLGKSPREIAIGNVIIRALTDIEALRNI